MDAVNYIIDYSTNLIYNGGIFFGFFLVFIECFIPMLPLSVFVTLNVNAFGFLIGILLSWLATVLGSYLCYLIFLYVDQKLLMKYQNKKVIMKLNKGVVKIRKITLSQLVLVITLPFTPSFLVNVLAGISRVSKEKFLIALLIGKMFAIIFWGYIGRKLIMGLDDIKAIIYIVITLFIAYVLSKIVSHKFNIE